MSITDRYGLPITTSSPVAAERFQEGMDALLSFGALYDLCVCGVDFSLIRSM